MTQGRQPRTDNGDEQNNSVKYHKWFLINTFTAIIKLSRLNNSCLKTPASTLVDLIFRLCSFSLNQLTCHYRRETCTAASVYPSDIAYFVI
jgi:hypothetical protein